MIKVRVPATTANIGPGFDCVGCALSMFAEFTFERSEKTEIYGCPPEFANEDNLVYKSFNYALSCMGEEPVPVKIVIDSPIPVSRGLGSSSACVVAGVVGAQMLMGRVLSDEQLFTMCTAMEGHPDNVGPAIFGGLVGGFTDNGVTTPVLYGASRRWDMVTIIPDYEVLTVEARKVVKRDIDLSTSIYNTGHVLGLVKAIEMGDPDLLRKACHDKIHEPYRRALIKDYDDVRALCEKEGSIAFFISGSGSTMIAMMDDVTKSTALCEKLKAAYPGFEIKNLKICREGVTSIEH